MRIEVVRFAPEHLSAVQAFGERVWQRPSAARFAQWRWLDCPAHVGWLALRGGECLAVVSAMRRRYRLGDRRVELLETFDWHALPELRNSGVGIRVLRAAIAEGLPMLAVGGTETTQQLLPRLGWREQGKAGMFALPLDPGALATDLRARTRLPGVLCTPIASLARWIWLHPRRISAPRGAAVVSLDSLGTEVASLYDGPLAHGTVQLPESAQHDWLVSGGAATGTYLTLGYRIAGELTGIAIGRVYETPSGREAAIVDVYARTAELALWSWMVSALTERLAEFRPRYVRAIATSPPLIDALRGNRFLRVGETTVLFRPAHDAAELLAPVHLTGTTGDSPFLPYSSGTPI